jgi:hypothetical protein
LLVHVHLRRGQADARRVVHGFGHVGHQFFQALVELGDRNGHFVQAWIGVTQNI